MLSLCTKVIRTPGWTVCVALRGLLLVVSIMKYLLNLLPRDCRVMISCCSQGEAVYGHAQGQTQIYTWLHVHAKTYSNALYAYCGIK